MIMSKTQENHLDNMTVRELIQQAQELGEEDLDKDVIMFDGPSWYTPTKIVLMGESWPRFKGKVLID